MNREGVKRIAQHTTHHAPHTFAHARAHTHAHRPPAPLAGPRTQVWGLREQTPNLLINHYAPTRRKALSSRLATDPHVSSDDLVAREAFLGVK